MTAAGASASNSIRGTVLLQAAPLQLHVVPRWAVLAVSRCAAGSIYEYTLELASQTSAPSLEKHTAKLAGVVAAQAEELRRQHNKDRLPVPGDANGGTH
jgi:hypothetical protein